MCYVSTSSIKARWRERRRREIRREEERKREKGGRGR
jgi:hypothetical protein